MTNKKWYRVKVKDYLVFESEEDMKEFIQMFELENFEAEEVWFEEVGDEN